MVTSNNKYANNAPQKNLIALGLISLPRSDIPRLLPIKGHIFVVGFSRPADAVEVEPWGA